MTTLKSTTEKIQSLIQDLEFRAQVVELAVKGTIPMEVWNNDTKLQTAVYYKFASDIVLR